jgi:hypothetical protein
MINKQKFEAILTRNVIVTINNNLVSTSVYWGTDPNLRMGNFAVEETCNHCGAMNMRLESSKSKCSTMHVIEH